VSKHTYDPAGLRGDYLRAGVGCAICFIPLGLGAVPMVVAYVLFCLSGLFAVYGFVTYTRQRTRICIDDKGIVVQAWMRIVIPWAELTEMRLFYYATRRERVKMTGTGWMALRLKGPEGKVSIESTCSEFSDIVARAAAAAVANRLAFGGPTLANLDSLNIPLTAVSRKEKVGALPALDDMEPLL
jgi:hypothetical protein